VETRVSEGGKESQQISHKRSSTADASSVSKQFRDSARRKLAMKSNWLNSTTTTNNNENNDYIKVKSLEPVRFAGKNKNFWIPNKYGLIFLSRIFADKPYHKNKAYFLFISEPNGLS
jgi:hypothetical protein